MREFRSFARCYIDDIVIFSATFEDHLQHLGAIFALFSRMKISLEPKKSFLGYPSVNLLGRKVDGFGLRTTDDRVSAIKKIRFPRILEELETYLGLANYLRSGVGYYAQISEPLQKRKTDLLKDSPLVGGRSRKAFSKATKYQPVAKELDSFKALQEVLTADTFLHYYDPMRQLYADIDASKRYGFGVMVYHVKGDPLVNDFPRASIQPIMFLSKLLNAAESRYWPTELEVAALVWTIKKINHLLVHRTDRKPIIFTDHAATADIMKATSLSSLSTDKLNLRLIRASQYVSQYDLDIRWRPGKQNTVPDALSRLLYEDVEKVEEDDGVLDEVFIFALTMTEMSEAFKIKLKAGYKDDKGWSKIYTSLKEEARKDKPDRMSAFILQNDLIFFVDPRDHRERLCVPQSLEGNIFKSAHDCHSHIGFHRTYERVVQDYYFRHLSRRLRQYISHCPECQLNQTKRHALYGRLQPFVTPAFPFHTVTIDFVLGLPQLQNDHDVALTVTDKFSKKVKVVTGRETWTAAQWANAFLQKTLDWGIPRAIISDRDPKFMSDIWKAIFEIMGTDLLVSTAYHPQTDGQSERTNQTFEIALRYWITMYPDTPWGEAAEYICATLNNSTNSTTGKSPNEVVYKMKLNEGLSLLSTDKPRTDITESRKIIQQEATDALGYSALQTKLRYDSKHVPLIMQPGDQVFVTLHKGYNLPGVDNKKLSNQRAGPFKVLERKGPNAYKLELPPTWKINPVISVTMLEPAPPGEDPYHRARDNDQAPPLEQHDDGTRTDEVEILLDRRVAKQRGRGKGTVIQYLVKWKGWSKAHNVWYNQEDLSGARDRIKEYDDKYGLRSQAEVKRGSRPIRTRGR